MDRGEKAKCKSVLPVVIVSCRAFLCEVMDVTFKPSTAHTAFPCFLSLLPCANQPSSQIWHRLLRESQERAVATSYLCTAMALLLTCRAAVEAEKGGWIWS
jgi:hypothetical protein